MGLTEFEILKRQALHVWQFPGVSPAIFQAKDYLSLIVINDVNKRNGVVKGGVVVKVELRVSSGDHLRRIP
ncbi:hypothetical protein IMY05_010G0165800 [Salix suchowensis]|nr:hypothetical protein IMY05_010G0165800 [Salix suchowensis]